MLLMNVLNIHVCYVIDDCSQNLYLFSSLILECVVPLDLIVNFLAFMPRVQLKTWRQKLKKKRKKMDSFYKLALNTVIQTCCYPLHAVKWGTIIPY